MWTLHDTPNAQTRPRVHVTDDQIAVAGPLVATAIDDALRLRGRCRLGLCGGSTPAPLYAWLRDNLDVSVYPRLWITWVDERHLPVDGPAIPTNWRGFGAESNLRLAAEHWLAAVPMPGEQVLPMSLGGELDAELARFAAAFAVAFAGGLDVQVLGAGPDGHIGAVFPGLPGMSELRDCFALRDSPKPPSERIALSLPVLRRTGVSVLLATGASKADVLARAYEGDDALPLGLLVADPGPSEHHWVLDPPAATTWLTRWLAAVPP